VQWTNPKPTEGDTLDPTPRRVRSAEAGLSLQLWEWHGEGMPLVLLHGFGMSARVWDGIAHAVAPRHVIALDARGHGDSDHDGGLRTSHTTGYEDLCSALEELGLERFALAGHSMGAYVALVYASRHPLRVDRLALVDAGPDLAGVRTRPRPAPRRQPPKTGFESEHAYASALGVFYPNARSETLLELARHWLRRRPDGRYEPKLDPGLLHPRSDESEAARGTRLREQSERLWRHLEGVRCPTLVVRGARSTILSPDTTERMLARLRDARFVELANAGHAVMLDAPEALAAAFAEFLE